MALFGSSSMGTPKRLFEPGDFRRPFLILWPAAGSVRVVDGIILIHLGERPSDVRPQAAEEP